MGLFGGKSAPEVDKNTLKANSIARILDLLCEGPVRGPVGGLRGMRFDGTPLYGEDARRNIYGVEVEFRHGFSIQQPLNLIPQTEATVDGLPLQMKQGAFATRRITDPNAASVRIKIGYPEGLFRLDNTGDQRAVNVQYEIWIGSDGRDASRFRLCEESGKTTAPFARDWEVPLSGRPPWTIALIRLSSDSSSNGSDQQTNWATSWDACTILIGGKLHYPFSCMVAYRIDTSKYGSTLPQRTVLLDGFSEVPLPSNYDEDQHTYSGLWDGRFKQGFSDNPAWCLYCLLTNLRFGLGRKIDPSLIDKWAFYNVAQYCDELVPDGFGFMERRFACSIVMDEARPVFDVINDFASIFRGLAYYASGGITAVADRLSDPVAIISPANVIGGRITYSEAAQDARHSVHSAQWKDPAQEYKVVSETVEDGEMLRRYGYRRKSVTAFAAASRGQARRVALWSLATEKWEGGVAKFSAGIELAWLKPGDVVALVDPLVQGDHLGGRCRANNTGQLVLDSKILFEPGQNYSILVVMPDGTVAKRFLVTPDLHDDMVELSPPLDQLPLDGAMFAITGTDVVPIEYRILNIAEDEPHIFSFDVMRYERHKFAWIEQGVAFEPDPISRWLGPLGAPTNLVATSVLYTAKDGIAARLELSWSPDDDPRIRFYEVEVLEPGLTAWRRDALTVSVSVVLSSTALGVYGLRVRATADLMEPSAWTEIGYSYGGLSDPPPDVGSIWASQMNDMLYLEWTAVLVLDLSHYEIRAVGQDDQPEWERANQLLPTIPPKTVACALPLVPGVYMIKAVDFGGAYSRNAAYTRVTSDLTLDLLYDTITDIAPFNGQKIGTNQRGNDLTLIRGANKLFNENGTYVLDAEITVAPATPPALRFALDMIVVGRDPDNIIAAWKPIARAKPLGGIVSDQWGVSMQLQSSADGITWTDWVPMGFGYFRAKHYRFRATLFTGDTRITPAVERFTINAFTASPLA